MSYFHAEHQGSEEYLTLKDELAVLSSSLKRTTNESAKTGLVARIRETLQEYIDNALKSGLAVDQIEADLNTLCKHLVIPTGLWQLPIKEIAEAKERLVKEVTVPSQLPAPVRPASKASDPSLFCKDTLYHASLCCGAINAHSPANVHTYMYFQSKKPRHDLTEVSFSQESDELTPYLIAKQKDIIYVAFRGIPFLSKWIDTTYTSFNEGSYTENGLHRPFQFKCVLYCRYPTTKP